VSTPAFRDVLLYGAGGHALVCIDVLLDDPANIVTRVVSDGASGRPNLGFDIEDAATVLQELTESSLVTTFCVGIGRNQVRQKIVKNLTLRGHSVTGLVSRSAVVSSRAEIGSGVQILPGAVVMAAARLGDGVIINTNASVDHDGDLGEYVHVAPGVAIAGDVTIGARTLVGVGARILPGCRIGADVVIGGGAVVVDDIADGITVVGNPARPIRQSGTSE
jgi:UDP-perosamine 4-acetyltransferase